jgi:hypothetical protein
MGLAELCCSEYAHPVELRSKNMDYQLNRDALNQLSEAAGLAYMSTHKTTILLIIGLSSFSYNWVGEPPPITIQ